MSALMPRHPVVVLAHGHGSRLAAVARCLHKTAEAVRGRPLLWWLLHEIEAAGLTGHTVLSLRQDDPVVHQVLTAFPWQVDVRFRQPGGYLSDVYQVSREYGPRFTVIEADTITAPGTLRNFLLLVEQIGGEADLCVGVAPIAANPHGPAVRLTERGMIADMSWTGPPTGLVPLAAWHWRSSLLDYAAEFAQHSSSVADFVSWTLLRGARVVPIGVPAGFNINTPADLDEARTGTAAWFGARAPAARHSAEEDRCSPQPWPARPV